MLSGYAPILFYGLLLAATGAAILLLGHLLGPFRPRANKLTPYECGVPVQGSARERFSVKFYLVAILFILFDIETVFLLPWSVVHKQMGIAGLLEVLIFLLVLGVGFYYIYRRGALEWD